MTRSYSWALLLACSIGCLHGRAKPSPVIDRSEVRATTNLQEVKGCALIRSILSDSRISEHLPAPEGPESTPLEVAAIQTLKLQAAEAGGDTVLVIVGSGGKIFGGEAYRCKRSVVVTPH